MLDGIDSLVNKTLSSEEYWNQVLYIAVSEWHLTPRQLENEISCPELLMLLDKRNKEIREELKELNKHKRR